MNANLLHPLTKTQSDFAAKHYGLVFDYLAARKLNTDDYHDVVILSYLYAVQQHDECPDQCRCGFEAFAGDLMGAALYQHRLVEQRRNRVLSLAFAA